MQSENNNNNLSLALSHSSKVVPRVVVSCGVLCLQLVLYLPQEKTQYLLQVYQSTRVCRKVLKYGRVRTQVWQRTFTINLTTDAGAIVVCIC